MPSRIRRPRPPVTLSRPGLIFPEPFLLAAPPAPVEAGTDPRVWNQVGRTGAWKGHRSGPFELERKDLDQIVGNFRRHPWYRPGPDGVGCADVIPYDFHHASEGNPSELAVTGAPAQAWAQELEVRPSEKSPGQDDIWALTRYLPRMELYAKDGSYKSCSMVIYPHAIDPVSGADVGWYMASIAFTNDPFIQGMEPIAADRAFALGYHIDPYNPPSTPEDLVCALRELLGLDKLAELGQVVAEVAKLRTYVANPASAPAGVDVSELVGGLRRLLNLPTLSDAATVFGELDQLVARLASSSSAPTELEREPPMSLLQTAMIGRFALAAASEEKVVLDRVQKELEAGASAQQRVQAFAAALGVEDTEAAYSKIATLMKQAADLEAAMPELAELRAEKKKRDEESEEAEVSEVMATRKMPDTARVALLSFRRSDVKAFRKEYPPLTAEQRALLTNVSGTAPTGTAPHQLSGTGNASGAGAGDGGLGASALRATVELEEGATLMDKCVAHTQKEVAKEGKTLTWEQTHERAVKLYRTFRPSLSSSLGTLGV